MSSAIRFPTFGWRGLAVAGAMMVAAAGVAGLNPAPAGAQSPSVTLYEHINYGGATRTYSGDVPDLRPSGFNDKASSIVVPAGAAVSVYEHINYGGRCEVFRANDSDLRDNAIGNDRISSLRVGRDCAGTPINPPSADCPVAAADLVFDQEEQTLLSLINQYRQQNGRAPLAVKSELNRGAAWLSRDFATNNYVDHLDSNGRPVGNRLVWCGSDMSYLLANAFGENIAGGSTAQAVFDFWKGSSGHNANMLNASFRFAGIGRAANASGQWFWALDLTS